MSGKWGGVGIAWDEAVLLDAFKAEFCALASRKETIAVELTPLQMWALLSTVQLACRHPLFRGQTRQLVVEIGRVFQAQVAPSGALAEVAEKGWDAAYDQVPVART